MSKFQTAKTLWQKDKIKVFEPVFTKLQRKGLLNWISDKLFLKIAFRLRMGYPLDLKNPKTFNEKLQWLKLYDYKPEYDMLVDKYEVKRFVSEKIGVEYVIPTYGIWNSVEDINWNSLPNQFVIKTTHGSGGQDVFICRDKSSFDIEDCKKKLQISMAKNTYGYGREKTYKNLLPRIMAEKLLVDYNRDITSSVNDYKFMCFDGKVHCSFTCTNRFQKGGLKVTFYDRNWNMMPFERNHPKEDEPMKKPENYNEMIKLAEILSSQIPFVRVDFYDVNGKIYFGELTFYPGSGYEAFQPHEWDKKLGDKICLSSNLNKI